ncbi:hypothetical protein [Alsobacter sp. R-9]
MPIAVLVLVAGQFLAGFWYVSKVDSKVAELDKLTSKHDIKIDTIERDARLIDGRLVRIEANSEAQLRIMQRLERIVDATREPAARP